MSATTTQGAGTVRPPAYSAEIPRGSLFLLLAAWIVLAEGALALLFLPVLVFASDQNIAPSKIVTFSVLGIACLVAGGLLYTRWRPAGWLAAAAPAASAAWLVSTGGLSSSREGDIASVFAAVVLLFLVLGRRAVGKPEAMALASARISFRLKVTVVWLSIFFVLGLVFALAQFDVDWMKVNFSFIAGGLKYTILLALFAIVLAVTLALLGALGRLSRNPVAYGVSGFYTSFFRGTPLIVQLFLLYLALPQIARNFGSLSLLNIMALTTFQVGVIGLGLNYGAYMTEIFRAGIQSVGHGQAEAAEALGMTYPQRMRRVVLPQATRVIIPPTGNEFIAMMKDTALVSFLGIEITRAELFRRSTLVGQQDLRNMEALVVAAGLYWLLTAIFTVFQARLERRMSKGYVRTEVRQGTGAKRHQFIPGGSDGGGGGIVIKGEGTETGTEGMP